MNNELHIFHYSKLLNAIKRVTDNILCFSNHFCILEEENPIVNQCLVIIVTRANIKMSAKSEIIRIAVLGGPGNGKTGKISTWKNT